jgi:acylaminoacyl-peptidase
MFKGRVEDEGIEEVEGGSSYMGTLFPKFSPDGRFLTFYGVPIGSISHCMCVSLVIRDLNTGETRELVPRVFEFNSKFNGIYGFHEGLSTYNWIDNETIVFSSNHDASECLFSVNLSGDVQELVLPLEKPYLSTILDVFAGTVMVKASNFKTPDQVYLLNISNNLSPVLVESCLHQDLNPKENEIRARLDQIETTLIKSESSDLKSILYHKPGTKNLLAVLHGGPHSISFSGYALSTSLRSLQDMSILLINYSGSTGFGSNLLTTLLGKIGDLDVEDCIKSINQAKSLTGCSKVITFGGSHGGFLSTHLASRMELSGCVTINGALDVASMHLATDINDWGLAEVCASDLALPPSPEQYRAMYAASPVSRAGLITCPVLICAGSGDLRVPAFTSQEMFRVLKANQKDCQMLWYHDEGHGVLGKAASFDLIVNTTAWIMEKFENS